MKLAVIPARGGSKRITRKNIRNFLGRPIMSYSIETAIKSGLFDRVIVSTDDSDIAECAQSYGAEVPFIRPAELADDYAVINEVMQHAIGRIESQGETVELACCVYATAPMMCSSDLAKGVSAVIGGDCDFALSVCEYPFPIQRALGMDEYEFVSMLDAGHSTTRSQDLPPCYHDAAHFYCGSGSAFMSGGSRVRGITVPRYRVCDIDTEMDWKQAELMMKVLGKGS